MLSLVDFLTQTQTVEEEIKRVLFSAAFIAFTIYEFAVFFRFLWKKWRRG